MRKLTDLRVKEEAIQGRMSQLVSKASGERRALSVDERKELDDHLNELESVRAKIRKLEGENHDDDDRGNEIEPRRIDDTIEGQDDRPAGLLDVRSGRKLRTYSAANVRSGDGIGRLVGALATGKYEAFGLDRRAVDTGASSGGAFVPTDIQDDFVGLLHGQSRVLAAGARTFAMEHGNMSIATQSGKPSVTWNAESAQITADSSLAFTSNDMTAKKMNVLVYVSNELMHDAPNASEMITRAIVNAAAEELDSKILTGDGTGNTITGILETAGIGSTDLSGSAPTIDDYLDAGYSLVAENVPEDRIAIIHSADAEKTLRKIREGSGSGTYLLAGNNSIIPWRRFISNLMPDSTGQQPIVFGDFSSVLLGITQDMEVMVSRDLRADYDQTAIRLTWRGDVALARASDFHAITSALVG